MKFLWILESGIHCLILLLLSVFLLEARGTSASASTVLPFRGSTLMVPRNFSIATEKSHSAKTPASITSISNGTREELATATIKIAVPGTSDTTTTTPGNHSRITAAPPSSGGPSTAAVSTTGANITIPEIGLTTQDPGRRPLTFWAIILICLTVSGLFIGGYIGCCFLWKKNIF